MNPPSILQASGGWWIGPAGSVGNNTGYWRNIDSARVPENIKNVWEVSCLPLLL